LKESDTPEGVALTEEIRTTVEKAIEQLPEDLRTAIVLRELEGMSYEEIAEAMDCPVGTVRSRFFRAREAIDKRVKPLLEEYSSPMSDPVKEQLSACLDGELSRAELDLVLRQVGRDSELKQAMSRYAAIGEALRSSGTVRVSPDFASRVAAAVEAEQPLPVSK